MNIFLPIARARAIATTALVLLGVSCGADAAPILYASNFGNNTITAYSATTGAFLGTPVAGGSEANGFNGVVVLPDGGFLVAAQLTNNIVQYSASGALVRVFDPANAGDLNSPQDLAIGPDGKLYVASAGNDKILKYDIATGNFIGTFADLGGSGHVGPIGLSFGADNNLYVTTFDVDLVLKINGTTGAVISVTAGLDRMGFGPNAFGPNGKLYFLSLDLSTFLGSANTYDLGTHALNVIVSQGSGGFEAPGGLAFGPGSLFLVNLAFDQDFQDIGSTILRFNPLTGAPLGLFVGPGNGLNIPFFLRVADTPAAVPEPATLLLLAVGGAGGFVGRRLRRQEARRNLCC